MEQIIDFFLGVTEQLGYLGIFVLMTVESSFIPFPSEIVIPPAAYLAYKGEMNIFLVVFYGILGSLVGASINYFIAVFFGRKFIYKLAGSRFFHFLLITEDKLKNAEDYCRRHGNISTFLGRLVPGIRQLISIPAGFVKMNFFAFLFYTFLGSGFWVIVLAFLGYYFGYNQELLSEYYLEITLFSIFFVILVLLFYVFKPFRSNR